MRVITTSAAVYGFDELDTDAQEVAVDQVHESLAARSWDSFDIEQISDTIVYTLAERLRVPGWDTRGEGDFPGVPGVKLLGWDLDRGQSLAVAGTLDRDNAPALPWVDRITQVDLDGRYGTTVTVVEGEPECDCPVTSWEHVPECVALRPTPVPADLVRAVEDAVSDALHEAWKAGRAGLEYRTGEEYARKLISDGTYEFTVDGVLYR